MDFSKYANKSTVSNQVRAAVSPEDFETILDTMVTVNDFYMGRTLSSIYWSAVISAYNAVKNQFGNHAPSFIARMEQQLADAVDVVHWLYTVNYRPDPKDEFDGIEAILRFVSEEYTEETETALVVNQFHRELKKHNKLLSPRMNRKVAVREFKQLPDDVREKHQAIIDANLERKRNNQKSAQDTVKKLLEQERQVSIKQLNPERLYGFTKKLDEKIASWIEAEENKKYQAGDNQYIIDNCASTLEMLDVAQELVGKILREAEEVERSNTQEEVIQKFENSPLGLNDQPDSSGVNDYNGGYNVA